MNVTRYAPLLVFVLCGLLAFVCWPADRAAAQQVPGSEDMLQATQTFCDGLNQADKTKVQGVTSPELWNRLSPNFKASSTPGSFGQFEMLRSGQFVKPGYAQAYVLCRHADGVEDVLLVTLKQINGQWKVCGGPTAMSPANPLK